MQTLLIVGALFAFTDLGLYAPLLLLASIVFISFIFVSLGLLMAAFLQDAESFTIITGFVMLPVYLLSGALFPVDQIPVVGTIARGNPMYYGVNLFRNAVTGLESLLTLNLVALLALAVAAFALATLVFDRWLKA